MWLDESSGCRDRATERKTAMETTNEITQPVTTEPKIFKIPADNLPKLREKIEALAKRARRMGLVPPTIIVGKPVEEKLVKIETDLDGETIRIEEFVEFYPVAIEGESPKFDGWRFIASCDYHEEPVVIRQFVRDAELSLPEKCRSLGPVCEHCKKSRARKDCFVLLNDDGRWIQVGRSCLKDFLGHPKPEHLAAMAEFIREIEDACYGGSERGGIKGLPGTLFVLSWACSTVARLGWMPKSKENIEARIFSTSYIVNDAIADYWDSLKKREKCAYPLPTAADYTKAEAVVAWAKAIEGRSEYEQNLAACAARSSVSHKNFGIVVSMVVVYDRAMGNKREAANSGFVGNLKERLRNVKVTCERAIPLQGGMYGDQWINIFRDANGNVLKWKTGKCFMTGHEYILTGTVKAHEEYRGTKQTELTRCDYELIEHELPASAA
jgi:hypothetical protein